MNAYFCQKPPSKPEETIFSYFGTKIALKKIMKKRVLLIEENDNRVTVLVEALLDAGYDVVARLSVADKLLAKCSDITADILVIDVDMPGDALLKQLSRLNELSPMPTIIFSDKGEREVITKAMKANVSAFVVDGLNFNRIDSVIEVAQARFTETQAMRDELAQTRETLAERKMVEKAKGIIMKQRNLDEESAYKALRKMAMNQNQKIQEVAKNIITVTKLLY